jgi:two-component sensor histidine kinase/ligand-binding sensor protein
MSDERSSRRVAGFDESCLHANDLVFKEVSELSGECLAELLDPAAWRDTLIAYAETVNMAVALTDRDGRLLGTCHNSQPVWTVLRQSSPESIGDCPFCLALAKSCNAVAEALRTGGPVMVEDGAGLCHIAVPLCLGGRSLGALIAGQVVSRESAPLPPQRIARQVGMYRHRLWNEATHQAPVSKAYLITYGQLLMTLGNSLLGQRYATILHGQVVETNRRLRSSLQEKEVMLREIHHRVKNNLQIISSLLNLQSDRLDDVADLKVLEALKISQQRIAAMARIHDWLYSTELIGEVNLAEYVTDLAGMVISSLRPGLIRIRGPFNVTPILLSVRQAIPCGLIVNELVTNICKYAYPATEGGDMFIDVKLADEKRVALTIRDKGAGMPLDWQRSSCLGHQIVNILTKQLRGILELDAQDGTAFTILFPQDV